MFSALHECGHVSLWRTQSACPNVNEWLTCSHCGKYVKVTKVVGPQVVKCLTSRCGFHDKYTTVQGMQRAVVKHLQEWSTHRVRIWQFGDVSSVRVVTSKETGIQPTLISDAPF